jgi:undecaprenyl diphosphate synthase
VSLAECASESKLPAQEDGLEPKVEARDVVSPDRGGNLACQLGREAFIGVEVQDPVSRRLLQRELALRAVSGPRILEHRGTVGPSLFQSGIAAPGIDDDLLVGKRHALKTRGQVPLFILGDDDEGQAGSHWLRFWACYGPPAMADPTVEQLKRDVAKAPVPRHVGIIMDGNGRWAQLRGKPRVEGHRIGSESVRAVTRTARQIDVGVLTLYAFSSQNWLRPPDEVEALMNLLREYLIKERAEIMDNDIRLTATGDLDRLPGFVREPLDELCKASSDTRHTILNLALSYGGREEIVAAAKAIAKSAKSGQVDAEAVDAERLGKALWTGSLPDVDLVIRTSGEKRLSNFMLWGAAYAELFFTDCLWPDFREAELLRAILDFQTRERRFGLTSDQVRSADLP